VSFSAGPSSVGGPEQSSETPDAFAGNPIADASQYTAGVAAKPTRVNVASAMDGVTYEKVFGCVESMKRVRDAVEVGLR
jgi:hypothetical protein